VALTVGVTLWIGGCGDFVPRKTTGAEAQSILDDLSKIKTTSEPNIPMPSIYKRPPKIVEQIVGGAPEFKLFYFCQHHTALELEAIVHKQFATLVFNAKGKSTAVKDYTVSSVSATNQLIVRCPTRNDVEAVLELLEHVDIPPIQVKIDCIISEVYADKTFDWQTTTLIEELFGENIWAGPTAMPYGMSVSELLYEAATLPAFPGASLRELSRAKMGLKVGYVEEAKYTALIDILESQGYLKILMNPSLETVNGKTSKISSSQHVPLQDVYIRGLSGTNWVESRKEYIDVVDSLEITPRVFADGYIGLETTIILGSKLTPEGIKQLPIVTKKEIQNKENRIRPGESLIIGGLRKTERRDVVRGIPFLKDIPILGILFSGRDFEERAVETIFILTPTISTGGIPRKEMMEEVERKQEIGGRQEKFQEAEKARMEAEAEKAEARAATREAEEQARKAEAEVQKATIETEKAAATEQQAKIEVEKAKAVAKTATEKAAAAEKQAKAEAEKVKAEAKTATEKATAIEQQAQAQIEKLKAETEKLKAEAEIAKADAQKATAEVEKAKAEAQKATAEAEKAKAEAQKATVDAATTKAEAEKLVAEAEKAKAEAEKATADAATTKAEAEKLAAEAEKAKADAEKATAKAEAMAKAKQEATEKPKEEAEKLKAEAEKAKADAERLMAEAEEAKAEAETKAKAAEKAKAKADATAKAVEEAKEAGKTKTRAENPPKKGKAKNKAEAEKLKARAKKREAAKKARAKREEVETERRQRNKQKQPKRKPKRPKKRQNKTNGLYG
jgi:hypothetical protein